MDTLKDIYFAECQILKNLPKMTKAAKSPQLKGAFLKHCDQTEQHVERLQGGIRTDRPPGAGQDLRGGCGRAWVRLASKTSSK